MKKTILILLVSVLVFSCKNEGEKTEIPTEETTAENTDIGTFRGEFIYVADGAVLKGVDFIYGVELDEMASELAKRIAPAQKSEFDMVPVVVQGTLSPKPEGQEGWDEILKITQILYVSKTASEADIKIEETE